MKRKLKMKWWYIPVCVLLVGTGFVSGRYAGAASGTPGSEGDPLVTLSYLEGRLEGQNGGGKRIKLEKGQKLTGEPGTVLILLGGSATATGDALVDVTEGCGAKEDTSLFPYHSYVVTEKTAGCEALSGCTIFVSGEYGVKR